MRETKVKYRRPHGTEWEELELEHGDGHDRRPRHQDPRGDVGGRPTRTAGRSTARSGIAFLGGATLDTEENYLIKKFFTAAGAVSIENQARI